MSGVKICSHLKMDGIRCGGIALVDKSYCRFHDRFYRRNDITNYDYDPPVFEDSRSVLIAIHELVRARAGGQLDNRDLKTYMYAYQVAASLASRIEAVDRKAARRAAREEREKQLAKTAAGADLEQPSTVRDPKDDRNVLEFLLDGYHDFLEDLRAKEAEKAGEPAPAPRPQDRRLLLHEVLEHSPGLRDIWEPVFDRTCRRFPNEENQQSA